MINFPDHLRVNDYNTPIIQLPRFFSDTGHYRVWIKRDDLTGLELSGNKVRKLDFLLARAQSEKAERIITCGGLQSNHCRATAYYATKLGLKSTLVLRGSPPQQWEGNFFLNRLLDIDFEFINAEQYQQVDAYMARLAANHRESCFIIPEGGSNETGAWGYVKCFEEIRRQFTNMSQSLDTIVVATGSGGTHAGLLIGKLLTASPIQIISINVCDDAIYFKEKMVSIMEAFNLRYHYDLQCTAADVHIIDGFTGEGYGVIGSAETEIIRRLARTEGIVIDPVYGAKALCGFEKNLHDGKIPGKDILFIHTGGIFGLFPYWQQFRDALP